uniref:Cysteine-rich PDZ-binding protein n=1 Tax=Amphiprion percula TaxID=161767 RepID=A0A3P8U4M5_AMPPE
MLTVVITAHIVVLGLLAPTASLSSLFLLLKCVIFSSDVVLLAVLGEKKLGRVITPDTWKDGARNTTESGGRKLNENKMLTSKKARFDPYSKTGFATCRICKSSVHQSGSHYCQGCAYKKGICAMCGKKVLDTKNYKQTSV